jgi:hypothetical protein
MHQTILSAEKVDSRIVQKLNDIEENSELILFDRVKRANQEDCTCIEIRKVLQENKKLYDEMLLKRFKSVENSCLFIDGSTIDGSSGVMC